MISFIKVPKNQISIALAILLLTAVPKLGAVPAAILTILCVGFTVSADLFFTYLRRRVFFFPRSGIITGLILTLIIDTSAMWYQIALIGFAAMAIKNFVRPGGKHIFNPAASGLAVGWLLFGLQPSWWAPSLYNPGVILSPSNLLIFIPILLIGYVSMIRFRRYFTVFSYNALYFVLLVLTQIATSLTTAVSALLSVGTLFYALLMLVEPMTSPIKRNRQLLYGTTVAGLTILFIHLQRVGGFSTFDVTLTALLLGNLLFFKFR